MKKVLNSTARRIAFTMAGGGQAASIFGLMARRIAFTMAEILLSLTIIGVVAAITLPSLTGNINERTWNTQRKALFSRLSQAFSLMPQVNRYGDLSKITREGNKVVVDVSDNAESFLASGLSKVFKINNICDNSHLEDCGLPKTINASVGSEKILLSDIKTLDDLNEAVVDPYYGRYKYKNFNAAAFETGNGENILVYYNPLCMADMSYVNDGAYENSRKDLISGLCVNMIYDLNGKRGPNKIGKDMGVMGVFKSNDPVVVAPLPVSKRKDNVKLLGGANSYCGSLDNARLPSQEELAILLVNERLFEDLFTKGSAWIITSNKSYHHTHGQGAVVLWDGEGGVLDPYYYIHQGNQSFFSAICVKRD